MQFVALHHVKIGSRFYTPGEIIDVVIPTDKMTRLLDNDAIRKTGASFSDSFQSQAPAATPSPQDEGKGHADEPQTNLQYSMMEAYSRPDSEGGEGDTSSPEDSLSDEEESADAMEDVVEDAPEIDAMDGIVSQPKATKAETPRTPRTKTPRASKAETPKAAGRSKKP